jgi:hypothetical protein
VGVAVLEAPMRDTRKQIWKEVCGDDRERRE